MADHQESKRWMILVASTWIQAFTGTNFNFSSYSTELKSILGLSQMQLILLSMASDMGKAFGWCSGVCLLYLPLWVVLFIAAFMGLLGYGLQWLVIQRLISLPYFAVFLLCLLAGCSICWFNTVCYVLCIQNFPAYRSIAISLSISYNSVSAALYNLIASSINSSKGKLCLLLNALVPLITSVVAAVPIICQNVSQDLPGEANHQYQLIFRFLTLQALFTGLYLLIVNLLSYNSSIACVLLGGALILLVLPLVTPNILNSWSKTNHQSSSTEAAEFPLEDANESEEHQKLIEIMPLDIGSISNSNSYSPKEKDRCSICTLRKDQLMVVGEEDSFKSLMQRVEFWLYYVAYFCGGTVALVYTNNLGQISESLGYSSEVTSLVSLYSACSFFGRLLSAAPDFLQDKIYYPRTGWFASSFVPIPLSFLLLVTSGSMIALSVATALIGLSSGFIFSAAVSITAELFGPKSAGVNHNILITNVSLGSFIYGGLAALEYQANIEGSNKVVSSKGSMVCIGRKCYLRTFAWWGWISLLGLASSWLLSLRTKAAYGRLERIRSKILVQSSRSGKQYCVEARRIRTETEESLNLEKNHC